VSSADSPTVIAVAPNGGRRSRADHPALPLTAAELAATAAACAEAGAAMIHLHVRDRDGGDRLVVQITSEALGVYSPGQQMDVVRAVRPEAVSLALRELAPDEASEPEFARFLGWLHDNHVMPQIILYTPEEAVRLADMQRRGLIPHEDIPVLYVLGRYTPGQVSAPADLLPFLAPDMPRFSHWSVCAFGRHEAACVTAAALLGGHARVGFENNLLLPDGATAGSNADLVAGTAGILRACGLTVAAAADLRRQWGT
jgi:uncharacterized protein (DUF849 family)